MPPVGGGGVGGAKHAGEVAGSCHTRSWKNGTRVRVTPRVTTVSRLEDMVDVVVGEAATAFVHAGEIQHPVARKVACDLYVTNERIGGSNLYRSVPRVAVVRGVGDGKGTAVAPGDIHAPIEWRGRVVVSPTRFAIVARAIVNAKMGPAIRVRGIGGLIRAQALTAAACIEPDGEPGARWFVVQSNRVAHGTTEGALAHHTG
jgi:hypothetical protein